MPFLDLVVNGKFMQISKYIYNPLTKAACAKYKLDYVDVTTVHTDLPPLDMKVVTPETYGLVYYFSEKIDLLNSISAITGLRLTSNGSKGTTVEAVTYKGGEYQEAVTDKVGEDYKFSLPGEIGCTAAINLGFLLLNKFEGISTRRLGVLFIFDREQDRRMTDLDLPVADDSIIQFCRDLGFDLMTVADTDSDCEEWPECKNQEGQKCLPRKAECRRKV